MKHQFFTNRFLSLIIAIFSSFSLQSQTIELSSLDGNNGFTINGGDTDFEGSGLSLNTAGDINGDGIDDIIIGATAAKNSSEVQTGASYIIFGSNAGFPASIDAINIDGSNGFTVYGNNSNDRFGHSVSFAGDVNGDGIDDIIMGASLVDTATVTNAGACYVLFGRTTGFPAVIDAATISGNSGFSIIGIAEDDRVGDAVSTAGDINADGLDDMIIGVRLANPNGNNSGAAYIVYGNNSTAGFPDTLSLSDLDGNNGFTLTSGETIRSRFGVSVNSAGDLNADGFNDVVIGASITGPNSSGSAYVIFGRSSGFPSLMNLTSLDGSNGFVFHGISANNQAGRSVSSAGDINGDGIGDLIVGAPGAGVVGSDNPGSSYVVFGSSMAFSGVINAADLNGTNGFTINGTVAENRLGISVGSAGDINVDGLDDIIIGAIGVDANGAEKSGASYILFGSNNAFDSVINASSILGRGMVLNGIEAGDEAGIAVNLAGDVNNDGLDDIMVGAWRADPNGVNSSGSSYVVFGSDKLFENGFE